MMYINKYVQYESKLFLQKQRGYSKYQEYEILPYNTGSKVRLVWKYRKISYEGSDAELNK